MAGGTRPTRGRSRFLSGDREWLLRTLDEATKDLPPEERLELEIFQFQKPRGEYGIRVRPGRHQARIMRRLGGAEKE